MIGRDQRTTVKRALDPNAPWLPMALFTVAYLPFVAKPFHIDDPLFLWAARQIRSHPLDFYGFMVNWYGTSESMAGVMQNPPLASYYVAAASLLAGWGEVALHLAMLLPALGAILGTFRLARTLGADPSLTTLLLAFTPAFLVSATTVMSDVLALCFWVWAVELWVRGHRELRRGLLAASALLMGLGFLTKYVDIALVPLLLAHGVALRRRLGAWALWLLVPVGVVVAYETWTSGLYGRGHFIGAVLYASHSGPGVATTAWRRIATGLAFTGGAFITSALFFHRLWSTRVLVALAVVAGGCAAAAGLAAALGGPSVRNSLFTLGWGSAVQLALLGVAGASILGLALLGLGRERSPEVLLLCLWVLGIFGFATFVNWSINVRSVLPMAPAVALLVARRVAADPGRSPRAGRRLVAPLLGAAAFSMLVAWGDHRLASTARDGADWIASIARPPSATVWFQGHWGFQLYAERHGFLPVDLVRTVARPGDLLAVPWTSTGIYELPRGALRPLASARFPQLPWITTMSHSSGAGFHSDVFGPLPFAFGSAAPERIEVFVVERRIGTPLETEAR